MQPTLRNYEKMHSVAALAILVRNWKTLVAWVFVGAVISFVVASVTVARYEGKIDVKMAFAIYPYTDSSLNELRLVSQEVESPYLLKIRLTKELRSNETLRSVCGYKADGVFSDLIEPINISEIKKYSIVTIKNRQDTPENIDACLSGIYDFAWQEQRKLINLLQRPLKQAVEDLSSDINAAETSAVKIILNKEKLGAMFEGLVLLKEIEKKTTRLREFQLALDSGVDAQMIGGSGASIYSTKLDRLLLLVMGIVIGLVIGLLVVMARCRQ